MKPEDERAGRVVKEKQSEWKGSEKICVFRGENGCSTSLIDRDQMLAQQF